MRISRTIMLAAVAAAGMFAQPVANAEAGNRWHMQFGWPFVQQGPYAPRPRYYYYEPYYYYDPYYGDDEAYYDPYYYEPLPRRKKRAARFYEDPEYYEPAPRKKKKKLSTAKAYSDPGLEEPAPTKKSIPQVSAATPAQPAQPKVQATKETASGGVTCDKAKTIIGNYGFAGITPTDCEGSELGFKAQRDGKSFSIKVSSLNGELTEVKRQ